jgi:GRAM domain
MLSLPTFKNLNQDINEPQQLSIPIYEITTLDKKMTAFVIPNAIQLSTRQAKYTFASFLSRDTTFDVIYNIWRLARPEDAVSIRSRGRSSMDDPPGATSAGTIGPDGVVGIVAGVAGVQGSVVAPLKKATMCACGKAGDHYAETAMDIVIPGTPDRIHNLMFASGFIKDFMAGNQKLLGNDFCFCLFIIVFLTFCFLLRYPNVRLVSCICWIKAVNPEYVLY